jgi:hypothetical protein
MGFSVSAVVLEDNYFTEKALLCLYFGEGIVLVMPIEIFMET